jgi:hypothetical protein
MSRRRSAIAATVLGLALWSAVAGPAHAAFTLSAPATAAFSATLNGADLTRTYTLPLTVVDTRATPTAGWNLTIRGTQFTAAGGKTLPTTASQVTGVTSACAGSCTTNPTNSLTWPITVPTGTAVKFFNAAANTGTGTFTITPTVTVSLAANTLAGSYTSTITTAIVSGP